MIARGHRSESDKEEAVSIDDPSEDIEEPNNDQKLVESMNYETSLNEDRGERLETPKETCSKSGRAANQMEQKRNCLFLIWAYQR